MRLDSPLFGYRKYTGYISQVYELRIFAFFFFPLRLISFFAIQLVHVVVLWAIVHFASDISDCKPLT